MSQEEKAMIVGFDDNKKSFTYIDTAGTIYKCINRDNTSINDGAGCKMEAPEKFRSCPGCGVSFE